MTSTGCTGTCHIMDGPAGVDYDVTFSHGATPHDGADYAPCLTCHRVTSSVYNANGDPHHDTLDQQVPGCTTSGCHETVANHDGVTPVCTSCHTGMNRPAQPAVCTSCHAAATYGTQVCTGCHSETGVMHMQTVHTASPSVRACTDCHAGYQKHAGEKGCASCHTKATQFHHGVTTTAGKKTCTACHAKRHAGKAIAASKCASCHKGDAPQARPRAQHSIKISKLKRGKCGVCHTKKRTHAAAVGGSLTCQTCHRGTFHGRQAIPGSSVCSNCHGRLSHASGYACLTCHKGVVHDPTPSGGSVGG
jgi:hypothetical protein